MNVINHSEMPAGINSPAHLLLGSTNLMDRRAEQYFVMKGAVDNAPLEF